MLLTSPIALCQQLTCYLKKQIERGSVEKVLKHEEERIDELLCPQQNFIISLSPSQFKYFYILINSKSVRSKLSFHAPNLINFSDDEENKYKSSQAWSRRIFRLDQGRSVTQPTRIRFEAQFGAPHVRLHRRRNSRGGLNILWLEHNTEEVTPDMVSCV